MGNIGKTQLQKAAVLLKQSTWCTEQCRKVSKPDLHLMFILPSYTKKGVYKWTLGNANR